MIGAERLTILNDLSLSLSDSKFLVFHLYPHRRSSVCELEIRTKLLHVQFNASESANQETVLSLTHAAIQSVGYVTAYHEITRNTKLIISDLHL